MNAYDKGDLVRVTGTFKNAAGELLDPGTVRFKFKDPTGLVTTFTYLTDGQLVRDSLGTFHVDIDANSSGDFFYRWESLGSGKAAAENSFNVVDSNF